MKRKKLRDRQRSSLMAGGQTLPEEHHTIVPAATAPARHGMVAFLSSSVQQGRWALAIRNRVVSFMGSAEIDLRDALIPAGECEIEVICVFGSVEITVPPGVRVTKEGAAFAGSFELTGGTGAFPSRAPLIRVRGTVYFGSVEVTVKEVDD